MRIHSASLTLSQSRLPPRFSGLLWSLPFYSAHSRSPPARDPPFFMFAPVHFSFSHFAREQVKSFGEPPSSISLPCLARVVARQNIPHCFSDPPPRRVVCFSTSLAPRSFESSAPCSLAGRIETVDSRSPQCVLLPIGFPARTRISRLPQSCEGDWSSRRHIW